MLRTRVIPCLLLQDRGLVKTRVFTSPVYVGDPINAVKIFNEKEVDELILLDISASRERRGPQYDLISEIASEAFIPLCYGGGVTSLEEMRQLFQIGIEKVAVNSHCIENPQFVREAADIFGSQSVVVSVDVKRSFFGKYQVVTRGGRQKTSLSPRQHALHMQELGAGEIMLNSVDRDGLMTGYDLELVRSVSSVLSVPMIAVGGAGRVEDFAPAIEAGASAVAAGSMFVFQGKHRAVLISYPSTSVLEAAMTPRMTQ